MNTLKAIFWALLIVPTIFGIMLAMPFITALVGMILTAGMVLGGVILLVLFIRGYYQYVEEERQKEQDKKEEA